MRNAVTCIRDHVPDASAWIDLAAERVLDVRMTLAISALFEFVCTCRRGE